MPTTKHADNKRLPGRFENLVQLMPPQAIMHDVHHENTVEMIDRLMASGKLTKGQTLYLETLVQLVQAYEASHHAIDTSDLGAIEMLRHLMDERQMNASDLARLLGVHASMGGTLPRSSRILSRLTVEVAAAASQEFCDGDPDCTVSFVHGRGVGRRAGRWNCPM